MTGWHAIRIGLAAIVLGGFVTLPRAAELRFVASATEALPDAALPVSRRGSILAAIPALGQIVMQAVRPAAPSPVPRDLQGLSEPSMVATDMQVIRPDGPQARLERRLISAEGRLVRCAPCPTCQSGLSYCLVRVTQAD